MKKVKDPVSGYSHLFGFILSIAALVLLIVFSAKYGEGAWDVVSFTIFGVGMILLYLFSSLYHLLNLSEGPTKVFKKFDHIMIYILIACCYTPVCLGPLRGPWGWSIFGVIWLLAILGTIFSAIWINTPRWLSTGIYLFMGWIVIIAAYPIITTFKSLNALNSLWWLVACGIFYTIGAIIYALKKPNFKNKYFGFHELFHLFILFGSFCYFWFIFRYVLYI